MKEDYEKNEELKKEKARKLSVKEGIASSVMSGAGDSFVVPYALALNATNAQVGFLTSFVNLFNAFFQLLGGKLVYKYPRRKIVYITVIIQSLIWLFMITAGYLYWKGILDNKVIFLIILFYSCIAIVGSLASPAWFSWMGDLVPSKIRGEYFSKRNKIAGFTAMIVTLSASLFLDYMSDISLVLIGFWIIFFIAFLGRFIAGIMFMKIYEPKNEIDVKSYFTLSQFLKKAPSTNFGRFAIYIGLINLATNFAGPFFAVYMLKNLSYSYFWFIMIGVSGSLFTILSMPLWGKIGDYYGNRKLLWIGAILIPFAPLPWLVSGNPIFLIFTAQVIAGFGWGAFNLAASNFIYDAVTPQRRAICVAYYTVINGVCIFLGAFMGGLFAEYISVGWINTLLLIFVISAILRALISIIMLPTIKEVRDIPKNQPGLSFNQYAYLLTPRPLFDMFRGFKGFLVGAHNLQKGGKSL